VANKDEGAEEERQVAQELGPEVQGADGSKAQLDLLRHGRDLAYVAQGFLHERMIHCDGGGRRGRETAVDDDDVWWEGVSRKPGGSAGGNSRLNNLQLTGS